MNILRIISKYLVDPRLKGINVNSNKLLEVHNIILQEKPIMRNVFKRFYTVCRSLDEKYFTGQGNRIEIGSGVSFIKELYPDIVTSDIKESQNIDNLLDVHNMNICNSSLRAVYGINCFHHFHTPDLFLENCRES